MPSTQLPYLVSTNVLYPLVYYENFNRYNNYYEILKLVNNTYILWKVL